MNIMKYCKKCLQPNTRPGIMFDEEQICYACRYEESKQSIDWLAREKKLQEIADDAKKEARSRNVAYDCVIGVSGGKDSTFQAVYAKERLGLHPLLINCVPDELTEIGRANIDNLSKLGFDMISIRPNPQLARRLARKTFLERGNVMAASEYCLWASAYIMAERFNIPLIIQGENAALTLGTAKNQETSDDAFSVVQLDTLRGGQVNSLIQDEDDLTRDDVFLYQIPDVDSMKRKGIRAIFLQYYTKEWSQVGNAEFAVERGMIGRMKENLVDMGRYRRYTALDTNLIFVNQMIKYLKFGFGFATDEACYDIREGRMTREEAIWYVEQYDGKCGQQYIDETCEYLSITTKEFWDVVDRYVNRDLFEKDSDGKWIPKFRVGEDWNN